LSSDYDTQASVVFMAVKKASEMVHVQMDPSNYVVEGGQFAAGYQVGPDAHARVYALENKLLAEHEEEEGCRERDHGIFHVGPGAIFERERGAGEIGVARFRAEN